MSYQFQTESYINIPLLFCGMNSDNTDNNIIVFCAHSDDQIFGAGGTLAKYAKEGKNIYTYIFSFGEFSHPWLKRNVSVKMRVKESYDVDRLIGGKGIRFFDLKEGTFPEDAKRLKINKEIEKIIRQKKPVKIFTHAVDDPHPDHSAMHRIVLDTFDKMGYKCDVYTFDIWNWFAVKDRHLPKLWVDISSTFKTKMAALRTFKSQKAAFMTLLPSTYAKAIIYGLRNGVKFAEVFRKIR